ncbi:YybH family protein [Streptomyces formicae]|uniref:Ketosteroid isomerase-like protein n=1 Tax=Streptomyces formicae TaxID=1616117 RepID=A0A291QJW2_9ACTN|nr:nuclear transport factor 2 family protein [Streptomyces formicae]ATL31817.1 Ketosteroid isomerase-like protein [Streptomyces formicae]
MTRDEIEVRALLESRVDAAQAKDIDRLMPLFASDVVYFDVVPPMRFAGHDEVRKNFVRWFDGYEGPITLETREFTFAVGADVAFAHMLHLDSGTRTNGMRSSMLVRSTVCCRRVSGTWLITHEHISLPIDPETLRVWLPPEE